MAVDYLVSYLSHDNDNGCQIANTICVHDDGSTGGISPLNDSDFVDAVDSWLTTLYKACLGGRTTVDVLRSFRIPAVYGDATTTFEKTIAATGTYPGVDGLVPPEVAVVLALKGGDTSRRHNGRIFVPTPRHSSVIASTGKFNTGSSWFTALNALKSALLSGHDVGSTDPNHLSLRVYSRVQHKIGTGDKTKDVAAIVIRSDPRWIERRQTAP